MRTNHLLMLLSFVVAALAALAACGSGSSPGSTGEAEILASRCGGFAGTPCPGGYVCAGNTVASDGLGACRRSCTMGEVCAGDATCEPVSSTCTEASCAYVCVPPTCGGALGLPCADGLDCIDDGTDSCEPDDTADCTGVCARP
jgi:hypothetical protein